MACLLRRCELNTVLPLSLIKQTIVGEFAEAFDIDALLKEVDVTTEAEWKAEAANDNASSAGDDDAMDIEPSSSAGSSAPAASTRARRPSVNLSGKAFAILVSVEWLFAACSLFSYEQKASAPLRVSMNDDSSRGDSKGSHCFALCRFAHLVCRVPASSMDESELDSGNAFSSLNEDEDDSESSSSNSAGKGAGAGAAPKLIFKSRQRDDGKEQRKPVTDFVDREDQVNLNARRQQKQRQKQQGKLQRRFSRAGIADGGAGAGSGAGRDSSAMADADCDMSSAFGSSAASSSATASSSGGGGIFNPFDAPGLAPIAKLAKLPRAKPKKKAQPKTAGNSNSSAMSDDYDFDADFTADE